MKVSTQVATLLVTRTRLRAVLPFLLLAVGCQSTEPEPAHPLAGEWMWNEFTDKQCPSGRGRCTTDRGIQFLIEDNGIALWNWGEKVTGWSRGDRGWLVPSPLSIRDTPGGSNFGMTAHPLMVKQRTHRSGTGTLVEDYYRCEFSALLAAEVLLVSGADECQTRDKHDGEWASDNWVDGLSLLPHNVTMRRVR